MVCSGLEVTGLLTVFHGGLRTFVVGASAALRYTAGCYFLNDILHGVRLRLCEARAGNVADGTATDHLLDNLLGGLAFDDRRGGKPLSVAVEDLTLMSEVKAWHWYVLQENILPYVHFGPV